MLLIFRNNGDIYKTSHKIFSNKKENIINILTKKLFFVDYKAIILKNFTDNGYYFFIQKKPKI